MIGEPLTPEIDPKKKERIEKARVCLGLERGPGHVDQSGLLLDRGQLLLGGVLQVLDDGLVLVHTGRVEGGHVVLVDVSSTGSLGAVEQSVDVLERQSPIAQEETGQERGSAKEATRQGDEVAMRGLTWSRG